MAGVKLCLCLCLVVHSVVSGRDIFGLEKLKVKLVYDKGAVLLDVTDEGNRPANKYLCRPPSSPDGLQRKRETHGFRPGHSTTTNTCNHVRAIPANLRSADVMRPDGLPSFYQKYTEAYGIPIISSSTVSDAALKRACYTVRFMFADHAGIRESYYKLSGHFVIIGASEQTNDIPELSHLDDWWNERTRGLGATMNKPFSTGAEENVLCQSHDRWHTEDIFVHEVGHAVANLGASIIIPDFNQRLQQAYNHANSTGLWANTYALTDEEEYWGEGVQSFFNVNAHANPPDGNHNNIDTHDELRNYDRQLFNLIQSVFPCNNQYLKRCETTRHQEQSEHLRMDCNTDNAVFPETANCQDERVECLRWASEGECDANPNYMRVHCRAACKTCTVSQQNDCTDSNTNCPGWASRGECDANPNYMLQHCQHSCNSCQGSGLIGR